MANADLVLDIENLAIIAVQPARIAAGFAIGTMAIVWLIERIASFAQGAYEATCNP